MKRTIVSGVIAAFLVASATPAGAAKSLTAEKWVAGFCESLTSFTDGFGTIRDQLIGESDNAAAAYAEGDINAAAQVLARMAGYLDDAGALSEDTADEFRKLPRPDVDGGRALKRNIGRILGRGLDDIADEFAEKADDIRDLRREPDRQVVGAGLIALGEDLTAAGEEIGERISNALSSLSINKDAERKLDTAFSEAPECLPLYGP